MKGLKKGDYVLATKYIDGDTCDQFCVGVISDILKGYLKPRYLVVDDKGENFRANGFRRAEKITNKEGNKLLEIMPKFSDIPGSMSVWWHLKQIRKNINYSVDNKSTLLQ